MVERTNVRVGPWDHIDVKRSSAVSLRCRAFLIKMVHTESAFVWMRWLDNIDWNNGVAQAIDKFTVLSVGCHWAEKSSWHFL